MAPAIDAVRASGHTLIAVAPSELFMTYLKTIVLTGFVVAMPVTLWQLWAFVAPGLYENERRLALPFVLSTTLAVHGRLRVQLLLRAAADVPVLRVARGRLRAARAGPRRRSSATVSTMYLAFGVSFELPIVLVALALAGVVTPKWLASNRKYAILVAFIVGAVLTPSPTRPARCMLSLPLCSAVRALGLGRARARAQAEAGAAAGGVAGVLMRAARIDAVLLDMGGVLIPELQSYERSVRDRAFLRGARRAGRRATRSRS